MESRLLLDHRERRCAMTETYTNGTWLVTDFTSLVFEHVTAVE